MNLNELLSFSGYNTFLKGQLTGQGGYPKMEVHDTDDNNVKLVVDGNELKVMILQEIDIDDISDLIHYLRNHLEDKVRKVENLLYDLQRCKDELECINSNPREDEGSRMKYHALLLFRRKKEIMDCDTPEEGEQWTCSEPRIYEDYSACLMAYADTPCPASQMVHANTREDLDKEIAKMKANYHDEDWLENNLYPYL